MGEVSIKYAAELSHVREVSLLGTADLAYWAERLRAENLTPDENDGKAQILIIAADAKFKGIRFREVSFSVLVRDPVGGLGRDACFLAQAFNSCRFFAVCERVFFSTPYRHGGVRVSATLSASIEIAKGDKVVFEARMRTDAPDRQPSQRGDGGWEGLVFLPRRPRQNEGGLFFARISGDTRTYPFQPAMDLLIVRQFDDDEIFQALIDSNFAGKEWAVREDAAHAKSKTYARSKAFGEVAHLPERNAGC